MIKYAVILGDGMPDYPLDELGGMTPLQYAHTPNMDRLARIGKTGKVVTVPENMPPGSDVANLSVFGYDPIRYYTGRSPIEAVAMGIELGEDDVTFRCNLVTLSENEAYENKTMLDYSADEISTSEAAELIEELSLSLGNQNFAFYPGVSYRHLLVWRNAPDNLECTLTPPHDISGREIGEHLPAGKHSPALLNFMKESNRYIAEHPVNIKRRERGSQPANSIWLWGHGKRPYLDSFSKKYGLSGSVISAVDLIKGIGICAGLTAENVPGATGNIKTDFSSKARCALQVLHAGKDFVYVHVEAPDEAGHRGELETKIRAIEKIDQKVVQEIASGLDDFPDYRLMVLSDHPTPLSIRTHTSEAVPFCIVDKGDRSQNSQNSQGQFSEDFAAQGMFFEQGYKLMDFFISRQR